MSTETQKPLFWVLTKDALITILVVVLVTPVLYFKHAKDEQKYQACLAAQAKNAALTCHNPRE